MIDTSVVGLIYAFLRGSGLCDPGCGTSDNKDAISLQTPEYTFAGSDGIYFGQDLFERDTLFFR